MSIDLEGARKRLGDELDSMDEAIAQSGEGAGTVVLDQSSVGRLSRMDAMQQQAMARGMTERLVTRKRKLIAALARVEAGSYGQCCECGIALDNERLAVDPAAVFCADCLEDREGA